MTKRETIEFYLNDASTFTGRIIDLSLIAVNVLSCIIFVLGTYCKFPFIKTAESAIVTIFIVEYLLRIYSSQKTLKYIFSFYGIIDFMAILPSILLGQKLVFLKSLKVLRILRFVRYFETETFFFGKVSKIQLHILRTSFTVMTILFVAAGFISYAEMNITGSQIRNFGDAFYFSVTTLSTVGFGDIVPVSSLGRIITVIMILCGAILIPWQAGQLIRALMTMNKRKITCSKCTLTKHDEDAFFCKACGAKIS